MAVDPAGSTAPNGAPAAPPEGVDAPVAPPRFRILGPLRVTDADGRDVSLGGPRPRELLAALLVHANQVLSSDRLVTTLWGDAAGDGAATTLRTHVATVRRVLAAAGLPDALRTGSGGYTLVLDPADLDAELFERLVHRGQEALGLGLHDDAATVLARALALWRGDVLADLGPPDHALATAARLEELRLVAEETAIAAALARGRHLEVLGRLQQLVARFPFRERFAAQLMLTLYRGGRQADALQVFADTRDRLLDELGLDPGPELRDLETAMLRQEPALLLDAATAARESPDSRADAPEQPDAVFAALRRLPVVGRETQLAEAGTAWEGARSGQSGVLTISGPAGVGKSRLAAELAHLAADHGAHVLVGRCDPALPHAAVVSALDGSPHARRAVLRLPAPLRQALSPVLPPELRPEPDTAASDPQSLHRAVEWLLNAVAGDDPLLLVVEDAERLDDSGSALLQWLAVHLPPCALLVVCFRDPPGSRHQPLAELLSRPGVPETTRRVEVGPLDVAGVEQLVAAIGGRAERALAQSLWERTAGNPFFARELLRDLTPDQLRSGRLDVQVPGGVRDVLRHRLRTLPADTRDAVSAAAVLGGEVEVTRLGRLLGGPSEEQVTAAAEAALAAGFLVEAGQSWAGAYAFPHDLMRQAVYDEIPLPRRQRLHLRASEVLLAPPAADADVIAAAGHVCEAGPTADPVDAAALVARATALAAAGFGYAEAVRLAEARRDLLRRGATPAEQADAAVEAARLRLRSGRGYDRAVALLQDALATYLSLGDTEAAGRVHLRLGATLAMPHPGMDVRRALDHFAAAERLVPGAGQTYSLHRGRMSAAMIALDLPTLRESAERCAELAEATGRVDQRTAAGWGLGWHAVDVGRPDEALARLDDAWVAVRDAGDPALGWPVANAAALVCTELLLDPEAGRAWCRQGLGHPRFGALAHPHDAVADQLVLALAAAGELEAARTAADALPADAVGRRVVRFLLGDWEGAVAEWRAALTRDLAAGDRHDAVLNARWLAAGLLTLGEEAQAVDVLHQGLAIAEAAQVPSEIWLRARLAGLPSTPLADAETHLATCRDLMTGTGDWRGLVGEVGLAEGALAARRADRATSDSAFEAAVTVFRARGLPWRRVAALRAWAEALAGGDGAEAHRRRAEADAVLRSLGAPARWWDETSTPPQRPSTTVGP